MKYASVMGSCGLACLLCSAKLSNTCEGCTSSKVNTCKIKACCETLKIEGCYACDRFPCEQEMFSNQRICAFVEVTKEIGLENLVQALHNNQAKGIVYHTPDGSKGSYDLMENKNQVKELIFSGLRNENQEDNL